MFFRNKLRAEAETWLIAGLGNPEPRYEGTRHNVGFAALDTLAAAWNAPPNRGKWQGLYSQTTVDGRRVILIKPMTYMNLSGDCIAPAAAFYKVPPQRVIVFCDDIQLNPGKLRIRPSGSAGGHNGLKSIIARLGSQEFARIRIGVGQKPTPEFDLVDWVLGRPEGEDRAAIESRLKDVEDACRLIMDGQLAEAQNRYNSR